MRSHSSSYLKTSVVIVLIHVKDVSTRKLSAQVVTKLTPPPMNLLFLRTFLKTTVSKSAPQEPPQLLVFAFLAHPHARPVKVHLIFAVLVMRLRAAQCSSTLLATQTVLLTTQTTLK